MSSDVQKTAALKVPILPHTAPEAPQPPSLKTPLYPHQLRALHRCLMIENDGSLAKDFGALYDYKSRGGCLADAVGMGKTATSIGLILSSPRTHDEGDTLVVAPSHLIHQWATEIEKFTDEVEVITGKREYNKVMTLPPRDGKSHRVVLVDVGEVLNEDRYWYDWRRIFSDKGGYLVRKSLAQMEVYKKAALFCVKSPRGPCSYEGYVYDGPLHMPFRPWRRVIFDEIQDLVSDGTESQKNLLQVSRTAENVWLLSATPFPHGNKSVYANHELLGFCRLKLDIEVEHDLGRAHPFEIIKRKLYIRSPKHVADLAVTASQKMTQSTVVVEATRTECKFYELEKRDIPCCDNHFSGGYNALRQMLDHPEACKKLREQINGKDEDQRSGKKARYIAQKNNRVGRFATVNSFARHSLDAARQRSKNIDMDEIPSAQKDIDVVRMSLNLAKKIRLIRRSPVQANPFVCARRDDAETGATPVCLEVMEAEAIHSFYCRCPRYGSSECEADLKANGRFQTITIGNTPADIFAGYQPVKRIIDYFKNEVKPGQKIPTVANSGVEEEYLEVFIGRKERFLPICVKKKETLEAEKTELAVRIKALEETVKVGNAKGMSEDEELKERNGSKCAALIEYLWEVEEKGESTIVFSFWHDTLTLVQRTLKKNELDVALCNDHNKKKAISDFQSGKVKILLLSADSKASGANLQCATNVVLLDPAGSSAEHGANLEQQAIGRAVRMGQENAVKVVRFSISDSIEEQLFEEIDLAAAKLITRSNDNAYMCENAHKSLGKVLQTKKLVDDEVFVGESMSVKRQLARRMAEAKAKNEIIVVDDSDDEDVEDGDGKLKSTPVNVPMKSSAVAAQVKVKPEPVTAKRGHIAVDKPEIVPTKKPKKDCQVTDGENNSIMEDEASKMASGDYLVEPSAVTLQQELAAGDNGEEEAEADVSSSAEAGSAAGALGSSMTRRDVDVARDITTVAPGDLAPAREDLRAAELGKEIDDFAKALGKKSLNAIDMRWLDKLRDLKIVKKQSGVAWVPGQRCALGKWCRKQRKENSKRLKGQKNSMSVGRLGYLNAIGFPWSQAEEVSSLAQTSNAQDEARTVSPTDDIFVDQGTRAAACNAENNNNKNDLEEENKGQQAATDVPDANINKHLSDLNSTGRGVGNTATTLPNNNSVGRIVSPPDAAATRDSDGLMRLLVECKIEEHCIQKFNEAGILSASQLREKCKDVVFMEKLVSNAGLTAAEAIRLQISAQALPYCTYLYGMWGTHKKEQGELQGSRRHLKFFRHLKLVSSDDSGQPLVTP